MKPMSDNKNEHDVIMAAWKKASEYSLRIAEENERRRLRVIDGGLVH